MKMLGSVQKDLRELQIRTGRIQVSIGQASLVQGSGTTAKLERTLDLRVIPLLKGFVCMELNEDHFVLSTVKDMGVNLAMMPLQTLHVLHQEVSDELRIREQHALIVISEFKVNNEHMFLEKA